MLYICTRKSKGYGSVAQLNRVLDYGSSGSRFESWRSHFKSQKPVGISILTGFVFCSYFTPPSAITTDLCLVARCGYAYKNRARLCECQTGSSCDKSIAAI